MISRLGSNLGSRIRRRIRPERGAAAVEFAIVAPLLFILVFGIIDFGFGFHAWNAIENSAREGARVGATDASLSNKVGDITARVQNGTSFLTGPVNVVVTCSPNPGTSAFTSVPSVECVERGGPDQGHRHVRLQLHDAAPDDDRDGEQAARDGVGGIAFRGELTLRGGRALRRKASAEEGVVAVLTALLMVVLLTSVAFTIDLGRLRHEKQTLQNAVDLSSLAGAGLLPVKTPAEALAATTLAQNVALANAPELATAPPNSLQISYKCVVSDANGNGGQDSPDLGVACGPQTAGAWSNAGSWILKPGRASHLCDPNAGDFCNTIVVRASNVVPYYFAPVIGINQGSTGVVQGAACTGTCGNPGSPLDVVMVLDRTTSMTSTDLQNLKSGAMTVLDAYDASQQWVGFVSLPYGQPNNKCNVARHAELPDERTEPRVDVGRALRSRAGMTSRPPVGRTIRTARSCRPSTA